MKNGVRERKNDDFARVAEVLSAGGVGVLPTDTLYGLVGSALSSAAVARVYRLRRRDPKKPMIVLIAAPDELKKLGAKLSPRTRRILKKVWPGKVSVIVPCPSRKFAYLHCGTKTIAFRLPRPAWLRALLRRTGPLVAPSANIEGMPPARTIREARKYFGHKAAFYVDRGRLVSRPSTLIAIKGRRAAVLRQGAARVVVQ